ncbi:rhodanese-like domain-containing protein [Francisellaceae bacterium]|nr:rhodanese-like domain-containing protein [Francisellaceae bacterium]
MANLSTFISANLWLCLGFILLLVIYLIFEFSLSSKNSNSVTSQEAIALSNREKGIFLDIRDGKEYNDGHIVGAIHTTVGNLKESTKVLTKHKSHPIIIYNNNDQNTKAAFDLLVAAGFEQATTLRGGYAQWKTDNLPTEKKS